MKLVDGFALAGAFALGGFIEMHSQSATPPAERFPQFENDSARVWKTIVPPHQATTLHHHDHPRVVVALTDGAMDLINQDGSKERHTWEAGKAYWLPAMPAGALHSDSNPGDKPIVVMVVELEKEK